MEMNIANKLTLLRVVLIPFFIYFFLYAPYELATRHHIALVIFVVASATDFLDGYLARSRNLVTTFGKFMDPLADKLLVVSALICFVQLNYISAWIVIIIVAREFIISGFRLVAASEGIVIAASWWGKIKTVTQMLMIIAILMYIKSSFMTVLVTVLIYAAVILTIVSLVDYIGKNVNVLKGKA